MESSLLNIQASKIKKPLRILRNFAAVLPTLMGLFLCLIFILIFIHSGQAQSVSSTSNIEESVKIGLLITEDTSENPLMREAVDVANLVLDQANASGGIRGQQVELYIKSVDGNWGAGSKQAVSLIFEHDVSVLLGFVDGRSAHLIEQVCTKAQVPFISTFSPDPTLSRINIPWFFSMMPHADQQAKVLVNEILQNQQKKNITVISSDDYDRGFLRRSFVQEIESKNIRSPKVLTYPTGDKNFIQIASEISGSDTEIIVFFGSPDEWNSLMKQLDADSIRIPVYTPIMNLDENRLQASMNPIFTVKPKNWDSKKEKIFHEAFHQKYGYQPGIYASYVYDGMTALLQAIRINGDESSKIKEALADMNHSGMNGIISFDETGMNKAELEVLQVPE